MFDKLCVKSWVMAGVVLCAASLLVSHVYAARTVSKAVSVQRGNKTATKTVTKSRGGNAGVAQASAVASGSASASASVGSAQASARVTGHNSFVALSHNGFAVANHHNFHNRAFAVNHGYNTFGHGYGGYNAVQVVQPVTFAIATPLTVQTATLPVEIVNAPVVSATTTYAAADPCATTVSTVSAPTTYSYATQKVVQVQKVTTVAVPLSIVGVKTVGY